MKIDGLDTGTSLTDKPIAAVLATVRRRHDRSAQLRLYTLVRSEEMYLLRDTFIPAGTLTEAAMADYVAAVADEVSLRLLSLYGAQQEFLI